MASKKQEPPEGAPGQNAPERKPVISEAVRSALKKRFPSLIEDELADLDKKMPLAGGLNRDDAKSLLDLMQNKLIETEIEIRKKGIAVGHEFISDVPSFALAAAAIPGYLLHFTEALEFAAHDVNYFAASVAGLVLLDRFVRKEHQVLQEFTQVYQIWNPYIQARAEANKIREAALKLEDPDEQFEAFRKAITLKDKALDELQTRFKASGLLFEGIKIPENYASRLTNGFYFDGHKVHEIAAQVQSNLDVRSNRLKELTYRLGLVKDFLKQNPQTTLQQSWDKAVHIAQDVWDNSKKIHVTVKRVADGVPYLISSEIDCRRYLEELQKEEPKLADNENYRNAKLDLIAHLKQAMEDRTTYCLATVFGGAHAFLFALETATAGYYATLSLLSGPQEMASAGMLTSLGMLGGALVSYFSIMVFSEPLRQTVDNLEKNLGPEGVLKGKIARYIEVREGLPKTEGKPPVPVPEPPSPGDDL